jgi:hypothetical protein
MNKMYRARFKTDSPDPRPINWPLRHPYWITGEAGDGSYTTIVAYVDDMGYLKKNWPEAFDIDLGGPVTEYIFSDRFPK